MVWNRPSSNGLATNAFKPALANAAFPTVRPLLSLACEMVPYSLSNRMRSVGVRNLHCGSQTQSNTMRFQAKRHHM